MKKTSVPQEVKIEYTGGPQGVRWVDSVDDLTIELLRAKEE